MQVWQQGPAEKKKTWTHFLPMANFRQFTLNQYQKVGQMPAHTSTPKNNVITQYLLRALRVSHSFLAVKVE